MTSPSPPPARTTTPYYGAVRLWVVGLMTFVLMLAMSVGSDVSDQDRQFLATPLAETLRRVALKSACDRVHNSTSPLTPSVEYAPTGAFINATIVPLLERLFPCHIDALRTTAWSQYKENQYLPATTVFIRSLLHTARAVYTRLVYQDQRLCRTMAADWARGNLTCPSPGMNLTATACAQHTVQGVVETFYPDRNSRYACSFLANRSIHWGDLGHLVWYLPVAVWVAGLVLIMTSSSHWFAPPPHHFNLLKSSQLLDRSAGAHC